MVKSLLLQMVGVACVIGIRLVASVAGLRRLGDCVRYIMLSVGEKKRMVKRPIGRRRGDVYGHGRR